MTDSDCYDWFAEGGPVFERPTARGGRVNKNKSINLDNSYVIPAAFARKWAQEVLEEINRSKLDKP
jgi:hypothetical protein